MDSISIITNLKLFSNSIKKMLFFENLNLIAISNEKIIKFLDSISFEFKFQIEEKNFDIEKFQNFLLINDSNSLKIYKISKNSCFLFQIINKKILKFISTKKNIIISNNNKSIEIYILNKEKNKFEKNSEINLDFNVENMIEININNINFLVTFSNFTLNFYENFNLIYTINNINNMKCKNNLKNVLFYFNNFLFVLNEKIIFLFEIKFDNNRNNNKISFKLIKIIRLQTYINSLCKYKNLIISGDENGSIFLWKNVNNKNFRLIKLLQKSHKKNINSIINVNNEFLLSSSEDGLIKIWS
jgi:WD40 repeat protein